jgi:hypothetical protein
MGNCFEVFGAPSAQICSLRKVLAQESVGVLVRSSLPGTSRIGEEDRNAGFDRELHVLREFLAADALMGAEFGQVSPSRFYKFANEWTSVHLHSQQFGEIHQRC